MTPVEFIEYLCNCKTKKETSDAATKMWKWFGENTGRGPSNMIFSQMGIEKPITPKSVPGLEEAVFGFDMNKISNTLLIGLLINLWHLSDAWGKATFHKYKEFYQKVKQHLIQTNSEHEAENILKGLEP